MLSPRLANSGGLLGSRAKDASVTGGSSSYSTSTSQPQCQQRDQALPASEHACLVLMLSQQIHGFGNGLRAS
jgi:hypothetical protein